MASTTIPTTTTGGDSEAMLRSTVGPLDEVNRTASVRIGGSLCAITAADHARQLGDLVDQGYTDVRVELEGLLLCTSDGLEGLYRIEDKCLDGRSWRASTLFMSVKGGFRTPNGRAHV